jgi:hypothetical protein
MMSTSDESMHAGVYSLNVKGGGREANTRLQQQMPTIDARKLTMTRKRLCEETCDN